MRKSMTMWIGLGLAIGTPALAQDAAKKVDDPNKVRCKSHYETGSLVKTIRECHTAAEWQAMAQSGRSEAQRQMDVMNSARSGG